MALTWISVDFSDLDFSSTEKSQYFDFHGMILTVSAASKQFGIQYPVSYHGPSGQSG